MLQSGGWRGLVRIPARADTAHVPIAGGPLTPKSLFVTSLACLLLAGSSYAERRRTTSTPSASDDQTAAQPAAPPPSLAQFPATPSQVSFQGGQLTISAQNSTLGDILKAVRALSGATIAIT